MKVKFTVTRKGKTVKEVTEGAVGQIERTVVSVTQDFVNAAKTRCPVSGTVKRAPGQPSGLKLEAQARIPGGLRASIIGRSWRSGKRYLGSCGFTMPHGLFVEFGTSGPSATIRPVRKKALAWYGPGRAIITRKSSRGGPIVVGSERKPRVMWNALEQRRGRRQSMPFVRPAWYLDTLPIARRKFRAAMQK